MFNNLFITGELKLEDKLQPCNRGLNEHSLNTKFDNLLNLCLTETQTQELKEKFGRFAGFLQV